MLLAQALGEYAFTGVLVEGFNNLTIQLEDVVGEWGTEGLMVIVAAAIVWRVVAAFR